MKIIISPAKQINDINDFDYKSSTPHFYDKAEYLYQFLKSLDYIKLKEIIKTSDKICHKVFTNLNIYNLSDAYICALMAYDGIQYKMMQPSILDIDSLDYLDQHLYIISGLYGLLKPFDKIIPYRLEMQSKLDIDEHHNLYSYWGKDLYDYLFNNDDVLINLASNEYAKAIYTHKSSNHTIIDIYFYEDTDNGLKEKGVYVKMARGMMVQYMALNKINKPEDLKSFNELGYTFNNNLSSDTKYIFIRSKR